MTTSIAGTPSITGSQPSPNLDQLAPSTGNADLNGGPNSANQAPSSISITFSQFLHGLNPLHHVPILGTLYREATGEKIPAPMQVLGGGILGGPIGMLSAALGGMLHEIISMPADTSRPPAPAGMAATGSDQGVQPVSPGTLQPGAYTTLATTIPDWLGTRGGTTPGNGPDTPPTPAMVQFAAQEYQRAVWVEKGIA